MHYSGKAPGFVSAGLVVVGLILLGGACYAAALLAGMALSEALKSVLSPDALVALVVLMAFLLWGLLWFAGARVLVLALCHREARRNLAEQRSFESRVALSDQDFGRLFPGSLVSVASSVRVELGRFIGREEVVSRLLPTDSVLDICWLLGVGRDSIDWAEFVFVLEARFGVPIWGQIPFPGTVADLVAACARATANSVEPRAPPDRPRD